MKFKRKKNDNFKIIVLSIILIYIIFSSFSCSSKKVLFITDPVFFNLFLSEKVIRKEIQSEAGANNYTLNFLEYDSITVNKEISAAEITQKLEKALLNGNQIILSPMLSNMLIAEYSGEDVDDIEDEVISLLKVFPVGQLVLWVSENSTPDVNYNRIVRNGTSGWYDAGQYGGTLNTGSTAFIYINDDEKGEINAESFSQGTEDSGAKETVFHTIAKNTSVTELRKILDSIREINNEKLVLGVYAGSKTADIIKLARDLGMFVICEQAEWLIDKNDESFGTIKENLPVVFERVFEMIKKISISENNENDTLLENYMIIPSLMDFMVVD